MGIRHPLLAPALLATASLHAEEFDKYPGEAPLRGAPTKPILSEPRARLYRTALRDGAKEGPNFNGHYRLVDWGCGNSIQDE
jgi:hypothetical protein